MPCNQIWWSAIRNNYNCHANLPWLLQAHLSCHNTFQDISQHLVYWSFFSSSSVSFQSGSNNSQQRVCPPVAKYMQSLLRFTLLWVSSSRDTMADLRRQPDGQNGCQPIGCCAAVRWWASLSQSDIIYCTCTSTTGGKGLSTTLKTHMRSIGCFPLFN